MSNLKVVKFGSEVLTGEQGLDRGAINQYCETLAPNVESGLVVITSGAVATGRTAYAAHKGIELDEVVAMKDPESLAKFSMLGGAAVNTAWQQGFELQGVLAGSLAVTHNEIDSSEGDVLTANVIANAKDGIVTVINEADALSDSELMKLLSCADNDELARHLSVKLRADTLAIITKKGGVLDASEEKIISKLTASNVAEALKIVYERHAQKAQQKGKSAGRGGMISKLQAAVNANESGVANVMITSPQGLIENRLDELASHQETTTVAVVG